MTQTSLPARLDAVVLRRWAVAARAALAAHRDSIDDLNVFPVPDADTGTNMFLTIHAAVEATLDADAVAHDPDDASDLAPDARSLPDLERFARAALLGARGNSGVIVSQLVRGLVERLREHPEGADAAQTAEAFERAAEVGYSAVTEPEEGTILTVAQAAAAGARAAADAGGSLADVVSAACTSARSALDGTTAQLDALSDAGVVDAGGAGLVVLLESLRRVVTGTIEPVAAAVRVPEDPGARHCAAAGYSGPRWEVMFVVESALESEITAVRSELAALGDSVLLVGAGGPTGPGRSGPWRGHVHSDDPDAVLAAAGRLGEVDGVSVADLFAGPDATLVPHGVERALASARPERLVLVAAVDGPLLHAVVEQAGAVAVARSGGTSAVEAALTADRPVLVLPGSAALRDACRAEVTEWWSEGEDVVVLDATSDAHVLAAVAVLSTELSVAEARAELEDAVEAVDASVATTETLGGRPAADALPALLGALGGQDAGLVTLVLGAQGGALDAQALEAVARQAAPDAEVSVVDGGDPGYVLTVGVER